MLNIGNTILIVNWMYSSLITLGLRRGVRLYTTSTRQREGTTTDSTSPIVAALFSLMHPLAFQSDFPRPSIPMWSLNQAVNKKLLLGKAVDDVRVK